MITFETELSPSSLEKLIKDIDAYEKQLEESTTYINEAIADRALAMVKSKVPTKSYELINSIAKEVTQEFARIYTNNDHAAFVEFGTGVVGKGNPHPQASEKGWVYDINEHGEKGWVYEKDGEHYWTKGQKPSKYMWQTYLDIQKELKEIAERVLKERGLA